MLHSPAAIQKALDIQSQFATLDLQYLFKSSQNDLEAQIHAHFINDDGSCYVVVKYPLNKPDDSFSGTKSLLKVFDRYDIVSRRLLPFYFGRHLQFIEYKLEDDTLLASYRVLKVLPMLEGLSMQINELRPIPINEVIQYETYEVIRALDFIISNSQLPQLYRLPFDTKVFERIRFKETLYSLEVFKSGKAELIRLLLVYSPFYRESQQPYSDALMVAITDYGDNEANILEMEVTGPKSWRGRKVIEVRITI